MSSRRLALDVAEAVRSVCRDVCDENREILDEISIEAIVDSLLGDEPPPIGYAIRCVSVDTLQHGMKNPFFPGSWMKEDSNPFSGRCMRTAFGFPDATIFLSKEAAQALIAYCSGYVAEFEVVEIYE